MAAGFHQGSATLNHALDPCFQDAGCGSLVGQGDIHPAPVTHSGETVAWLASEAGREAIRSLVGVDPLRAGSIVPGLDRDRLAAALTKRGTGPPTTRCSW